MCDIFISYSMHDGRALARSIETLLKRELHLDVFLFEQDQPASQSLDEEVRRAIRSAKHVLILFTPKAIGSHWVEGEISFAQSEGKALILCRHESVAHSALPIPVQALLSHSFKEEADLTELLRRQEWGIPVIIPAAGSSSGLYPINQGMPKILLPVREKPILHHIIEKLQHRMFSRIIILAGEFQPMLEYYASIVPSAVPVECVRSQHPLLPSALAAMKIRTTFMLHYSDIVLEGEVDWTRFVAQHKGCRKQFGVIGTLMTSPKYKLVVGRITSDLTTPQLIGSFVEKPDDLFGHNVNMAVSIFEPKVLEYVDEHDVSFFGDTVTRALAHEKFAHFGHDRWLHIQTLTDWYVAQQRFLAGHAAAPAGK